MQESGSTGPTILIIEHDDGVRTLLGARLARWGYQCVVAASPPEGIEAARSLDHVDVVLSDFRPAPGQATVYEQRSQLPHSAPPVFLCTLGPGERVPDDVPQLTRPFDMPRLHELIEQLSTERAETRTPDA